MNPVSRKTALQLYRRVYLIRKCEERIREEYPGDEMKTPVHLHIGAEGIAAGILEAIPPDTFLLGTYRSHGIYLGRTGDTARFFAELYGKATGCAGGKAGSMHLSSPGNGVLLTSAVVATTIPVAVGTAFSEAYQGRRRLTAVFFGDGAMEEGGFWESLNFACLKKLNILFVCEDNDLAIHTPGSDRRGFRSAVQSAGAFHCHTGSVDGYCPFHVREQTYALLKKMKEDSVPGFLHARYFRFLSHVGIEEDFHAGYRQRPSADQMNAWDPLKRGREGAVRMGCSLQEIEHIEEQINREIENSIQKAREAPFPAPHELFKDVTGS